MKIRKYHIGRWCTTRWDDVGKIDGIIVNVDTECKSVDVFLPALDKVDDVQFDQIVDIRDHVKSA